MHFQLKKHNLIIICASLFAVMACVLIIHQKKLTKNGQAENYDFQFHGENGKFLPGYSSHRRNAVLRDEAQQKKLNEYNALLDEVISSEGDHRAIIQSAYAKLDTQYFGFFLKRLIEYYGEAIPLETLLHIYEILFTYESMPDEVQIQYKNLIGSVDRLLTDNAPNRIYDLYLMESNTSRQRRLLGMEIEGMILKENDILIASRIIERGHSEEEKRIMIGMVTSLLWVTPREKIDDEQLAAWLRYLDNFIDEGDSDIHPFTRSAIDDGRKRVMDLLNQSDN